MLVQNAVGTVADARRFRGVFGGRAQRRGIRVDGSIDQVRDALRALGMAVTYEPIENGLPRGKSIAAFRTWGSPWTDLQEPCAGVVLTAELAEAVSRQADRPVMIYDYAFDARRFRHQLFAGGRLADTWSAEDAAGGEAEEYLDLRLRELKMRDWGIDVDDLQGARLPFSPPLIMEAYFLRLDSPPSIWGQ
jgi:hypothetical protein